MVAIARKPALGAGSRPFAGRDSQSRTGQRTTDAVHREIDSVGRDAAEKRGMGITAVGEDVATEGAVLHKGGGDRRDEKGDEEQPERFFHSA